MQELLSSLDEMSKLQAGALSQSATEAHFMSPRSSGCMLVPMPSNEAQSRRVTNARDSMMFVKNARSNPRNLLKRRAPSNKRTQPV